MQARYYDPVIGRFLSIDPLTYMDTGDTSYFNRYAYTANNPINLLDPSGMGGVTPCEEGGTCPEDVVVATDKQQPKDDNSPPPPSSDFFDALLRSAGPITTEIVAPDPDQNRYGYTSFSDCVGQSKVPIIGSAIVGAAASSVSLPLINKPRTGLAGGGPSGNKTSILSKASRATFGSTPLASNSALRGFGSGTRGAAIGRVASRGGVYTAASAFGYTAGAVGGCAVAGNVD